MGPPQAGKGTQAQRLANHFGMLHLATGDVLREIAVEPSERGRTVSDLLQRGDYVPDALVTELVQERMGERDVVLDGFPRTLAQAEALERLNIPIHAVFVLDVPAAVLVARGRNRLSCPVCGAVYSLTDNPPSRRWWCDVCGSGLAQRLDDAPATVRKRLTVYEQRSARVVSFYARRGLVQHFDGSGALDAITAKLFAATERVFAP